MRTLRRRAKPLLAIGAVLGLTVLALPSVLGVLAVLSWAEAVIATAVLLLGGLVCALGAGLWTLRRSIRALAASVDGHTRRVTEVLGQDRLEITRSLDGVGERLVRIQDHALPRASREIQRAVTVQGRHDYEQQVAWSELRAYLDVAPFMPALRGWAASPDVLRLLVRLIDRQRPELVVECGSGASSVWIGYALRRAGTGRLVAIEHEERYAELSRDLVAAHGLDDVVEVRHAPLTEIKPELAGAEPDGPVESQPLWYDLSRLTDLDRVGLLFVDGPPQATGVQARYPAVPALLPHCTDDAVVVLDDADRPDERALGDRWVAEFGLRRTEEPSEKGAHVFTRQAP
ncbi:class I SAM-dependent methyltransferase [Nocardiopsis sp. L17-MgMaSL7]|uniref:class I SAM-dependent methyltransferase n=1 Tax=Nocardiopsis sp. L17-MgMaSL7 TaxID=1938893 RepID=UPI000D718C18|nr:class I SAM-dependent methyltransferase [Nocardiopsis sp. L17-MgMaSL7]PWV58040.1 methyltransferase family protein [Nocardiopsis sp. L17-MgMaSL7]